MPGATWARPSAMIRSAARSASVTGDPSVLPSTFMAERLTARMAAPARITMSVSGSISAAAASPSITRGGASFISPVGAIVNGLEVLDDNPKPEDRDFALDLIRKSAKTASARLQFCRLAFGAAGSAGAQIDLGDAQTMARGHIEDGKITITWNLPRRLLPKNRVTLLLNMLIIAQQTIPRGGTLTIDPIGDGETMSFRVTSAGLNARLPQNIADLLSVNSTASVDAHAVQPYYTRLLAQACGLSVTLAPDGEKVVVTAA